MATLEQAALADIEAILARHRHPLLLFSGGKDSLALAHMTCVAIGARPAILSEVSVLFPEEEADVYRAARELGIAPVFHHELTPERLSRVHHEFFPPAKGGNTALYARRHWPPIERTIRDGRHDLALFGRRKQENTVPAKYYQKRNETVFRTHPLIDWRTEDVWAYLDRHKVWRPRCYAAGSKQLRTWVSFLIDAYATDKADFIGALYRRWPQAVDQIAPYYPPATAYLRSRLAR